MDECQGQTFRAQQEALPRGAFALVGAVAVPEVEPQGAGRDQDAGHFVGDRKEIVHPVLDGVLEAELALVLVVAEPEVRRAGDDAVDAARLEFLEATERVADEDGAARLRCGGEGCGHGWSFLWAKICDVFWQVSFMDLLNFLLAVGVAVAGVVAFFVGRRDRKADQAENERRLLALEEIAANSRVPRHVVWSFEREGKAVWYLKNVGNGTAKDVELSYTGGHHVVLPDVSGDWPPQRAEKGVAQATFGSGPMKLTVSWANESGERQSKLVN